MPVLTNIDCSNVVKIFPDLNCSIRKQKVWGTLRFQCSYSSIQNELSFSGELDHFIEDDYEIEIDFMRQDRISRVPVVYERSQIISSFAKASCIELPDLHIYEDDSCCLGVFPEYQWQGALHFIQYKVIPYFYWQSFRRIHGREPWKALSHGYQGIIEATKDYLMNKNESLKGNKRNQPCFCGSGKKTKRCCGKGF